MKTTLERLHHRLAEPEGLHLAFKEAKNHFVAVANEGGGKTAFSVTDQAAGTPPL